MKNYLYPTGYFSICSSYCLHTVYCLKDNFLAFLSHLELSSISEILKKIDANEEGRRKETISLSVRGFGLLDKNLVRLYNVQRKIYKILILPTSKYI